MVDLVKDAFKRSLGNVSYAVWGLGALIGAIAGPFGSYQIQPFAERFFYWLCVIIVSTFFGVTLRQIAVRLSRQSPPIYAHALMVGLMTMFFTPFIWAVTALVYSPSIRKTPNILEMGLYVAMVTMAICLVRYVIDHSRDGVEDTPRSDQQMGQTPRLMRRLPHTCAGQIVRLSVVDHQVKVFTTDGEYSLWMRFGDAIDEMDPVKGYCTHRSHWVVGSAVQKSERENGRTFLCLVNGDRIPVSRTYRPDLETAGFL